MEKDITNCVLRVIRQIWKGGCVLPILLFLVISCVQRQDPDSLSEEELARAVENLTSVATSVESYFQESQSLDDMVARIDEIKAIDGVVDAYATGTCFYVDIEGWGVIGYLFDKYNDTPVEYDPAILDEIVSMVPVRSGDDSAPVTINGDYKACVMNAQHKERQWTRPVADAVIEMFKKCGIEADLYDDPMLSFFRTDFFDYNLIFVIGHGEYFQGLHWLETKETFEIPKNLREYLDVYNNVPELSFPHDEVRLMRDIGIRDNNEGIVFQYYVSERWIQNSPRSFSEKGKAVLFMVPCQSLMGATKQDEDRFINDSLAEILFDKGAGLYVGYDERSTELAQFGGMYFFAKLLSGESFEKSLNEFPSSSYKFQKYVNKRGETVKVAMHILDDNGFQMKSFLVAPRINLNITSTGSTYRFTAFAPYSPNKVLTFDDYWDYECGNMFFSFIEDSNLKYGFRISKGDIPTLGDLYPASVSRNSDTHRIAFQLEREIDSFLPNTEYHVWPYIANGDEYNYGNEMVFKTGEVTPSVPVPEAVDMGLSVKWASFNVGASKQEDCGSYFAWGETDPEKTSFSWTTYKWSGGVYQDEMTKYCTLASEGLNGFKDSKVTLEPDDDAARKVYGSNWRMPTKAEFEELIDPGKCIVKWDSLNGVPGLKVTSKKTGKFIFLPAAGGKSGDSMSGLNTFGRYWSSSLNEEGPYSAHYLYFKADNCYLYNYYRYYGYPVRAVYVE